MNNEEKQKQKALINRRIQYYTRETERLLPSIRYLNDIRKKTKLQNPELEKLIQTYKDYKKK